MTSTAECGHQVRRGHAVVRRGKHYVCTACSLPRGTTEHHPALCRGCGRGLLIGQRITLRTDGWWVHPQCAPDQQVYAVAVITDGWISALG